MATKWNLNYHLVDPQLFTLEVGLEAGLLVAAKVGDVDAVLVDADDVDEVVPGPGDDLPLEVVPEGPGLGFMAVVDFANTSDFETCPKYQNWANFINKSTTKS